MKVWQLTDFGLDKLECIELDRPRPGPFEVLVRFEAASVNPRDYQIVTGQFTSQMAFPLTPLSDGAGEVVAIGKGVTRFQVGDRVTPLFFPDWVSGEALGDERKASSGLELPGVLREFGVYSEAALARAAQHLSATEAACLPCAGLTAWTSLVPVADLKAGDTVLLQGTGGVSVAALQFAKALDVKVIIISSSDDKLAIARSLGADHCINYLKVPDWGARAFDLAGRGVDAVLEIGGSGTLANSLAAIRHGGHIAIIGYMTGFNMDITVFPLIVKNANLHGIGAGNRDNYESMMDFIERHQIRPKISASYPFDRAAEALAAIVSGEHFGKLVIDYSA